MWLYLQLTMEKYGNQMPLDVLRRVYGYESFRPLQEEIIGNVLEGRDSLVLMPTGGGKSMCYQIPALMLPGTAIVISPLISLMKDQVEALKANGVAAAALNSGNPESVNNDILASLRAGALKLLYISPERLIGAGESLRGMRISLIAIDEAHCISQWGHDFRPEYTQLDTLKADFPGVPIMALTATADKITKDDILKQLHLADARRFISSFDRPNLSLEVKKGYSAKEKLNVLRELAGRYRTESGIIYCLSRKTTEKLAADLKASGVNAEAYHAGLDPVLRSRVQEDFINDKVNVICATIAFGMGIDKSNVRFVAHYNLPKSLECFYQEIGRGGRDGLPCETILFYNLQDVITLRKFADESGQQEINREKLQRMIEYAESRVCRRRTLLNYFGEISDRECGNCDVCRNPVEMFDGTVLVQKALSVITRIGEQGGLTVVAEILHGNLNSEIVAKKYNLIKSFGIGSDISFRDWRNYLLQMLQMGFIEIAYDDNAHLKVTALGKDVLYGRRRTDLSVIIHEDLSAKASRKRMREARMSSSQKEEDGELFELLRQLRLQLAKEAGMPPYIIFSDKTLHVLAAEKPQTLEEFGRMYGVGAHKKEQYGERFVTVIREYVASPPAVVSPMKNDNLSYMEQQKQIYAKAYAPWTPEEDAALLDMLGRDMSTDCIAGALQRNEGAIRSRIKKLTE